MLNNKRKNFVIPYSFVYVYITHKQHTQNCNTFPHLIMVKIRQTLNEPKIPTNERDETKKMYKFSISVIVCMHIAD